jgi:hypothetical protein
MKHLYLIRLSDDETRTLGQLHVYDGITHQATFCTLELPWKNNERKVSCIPQGTYRLLPRYTDHFGNHFAVDMVAGRSGILIHRGNYPSEIQGCILVGMTHQDIDKDGLADVSASTAALGLLVQFVKEPALLTITEALKGHA